MCEFWPIVSTMAILQMQIFKGVLSIFMWSYFCQIFSDDGICTSRIKVHILCCIDAKQQLASFLDLKKLVRTPLITIIFEPVPFTTLMFCIQECLERLFSDCGKIVDVFLHKKPTAGPETKAKSKFFDIPPSIQVHVDKIHLIHLFYKMSTSIQK